MAHDVFISHAGEDKTVADMVCAMLEQQGIRCWIAPRDIQPGADFGSAIVAAIRSCRAMVLVFSKHANGSRHIPRELELALDSETHIIPFRIENVSPSGALVYPLAGMHWLDALTPPVETHIRNLAQMLRAMLKKEPAMPPPTDVQLPSHVQPPTIEAAPVAARPEYRFAWPALPFWRVLKTELLNPFKWSFRLVMYRFWLLVAAVAIIGALGQPSSNSSPSPTPTPFLSPEPTPEPIPEPAPPTPTPNPSSDESHPHLVHAPNGDWRLAPGYSWVDPDDQKDLSVKWTPGKVHTDHPHVVASDKEGDFHPEDGYKWVNDDPGNLEVAPK